MSPSPAPPTVVEIHGKIGVAAVGTKTTANWQVVAPPASVAPHGFVRVTGAIRVVLVVKVNPPLEEGSVIVISGSVVGFGLVTTKTCVSGAWGVTALGGVLAVNWKKPSLVEPVTS
jgi:hypothetical protein